MAFEDRFVIKRENKFASDLDRKITKSKFLIYHILNENKRFGKQQMAKEYR